MERAAVIFDLDGTLLDTLEDLKIAANAVMEALGHPTHSLDAIRRFVGDGARVLMDRALPEGHTQEEVEDALARFKTYYNAHCREHTGPYPGIMEALRELKDAGIPMAVVSNKPDAAVQILCRGYFGDLFPVTHGESAACPRKPAPDMVLETAKALGRRPEQCIYVGDSDVDILTARNSGMVCLSVLWGFRSREFLVESGAKHFCEDPAELPRRLRELEEQFCGE